MVDYCIMCLLWVCRRWLMAVIFLDAIVVSTVHNLSNLQAVPSLSPLWATDSFFELTPFQLSFWFEPRTLAYPYGQCQHTFTQHVPRFKCNSTVRPRLPSTVRRRCFVGRVLRDGTVLRYQWRQLRCWLLWPLSRGMIPRVACGKKTMLEYDKACAIGLFRQNKIWKSKKNIYQFVCFTAIIEYG